MICTLGVQSKGDHHQKHVAAMRDRFAAAAARFDHAYHVDAQGHRNDALVCYFTSPARHERAVAEFADWWESPARLEEGVGYWRETFTAPTSHRETAFSAGDRPAGLGALATHDMVGPIAEHGYWGSARDRMPGSADDELVATSRPSPLMRETLGRRITIEPGANLCIIRSGQDSTDCTGRELELYTRQVYPNLLNGMSFLRDNPVETGCYSCRFMTELDAGGQPTRRTFGLASFVSLGHLEQWAALHPSHLAIFVSFLGMAGELGPAMRLRLWHEVYVLPRGGGHRFEYVNCHAGTGLLPFFEPTQER
ncbi:MAG TPA: phenylacetaldoxime dehydratase family protein [Steroidobacteraceae bacterium]|nr:phenylacetaldoxime dehydratase family protein [Steroidobacteraceae bacterium]